MSTNMYLKFEEPSIPGSSREPGHESEIEILSFSHGFAQPTSPTRGGAPEQATHQSFNLTKYLDATTNDLLKLCWSGKQIGKATVRCFRSDGATDAKPVEYLAVVMEHVLISNYSVSGGPGDIPVENVSLEYGIIQYEYKDQKRSDDDRKAKHNLETGKVE